MARESISSRMVFLLGMILLLPMAIGVQLMRVQFVSGDGLRELWSRQAIGEVAVPARRGHILDRNGRVLVSNHVGTRLILDPQAPGMDAAAIDSVLSVLSAGDPARRARYRHIVDGPHVSPRYILLERDAPLGVVDALRGLGLNGLIFEESFRRAYHYGSLASHVLGYLNYEGSGMTGLEAQYQATLQGRDGVRQVRFDKYGNIASYLGAPTRMPEHGYDIQTTLDATIQAIVEEELDKAIQRHRALRGTAIVMDPATGEILAMASIPRYDPNDPLGTAVDAEGSPREAQRNLAVSDMIEPGSTFKLVTAVAAIEEGVARMDEVFRTPADGDTLIHGQTMRDHRPLGTLTFSQAFSRSSNIAVSEIAMRLQPDVFFQYARRLGFGNPTNIDLPSEAPGLLRRPYEWSQVTLPWMSIGYEVLSTPIQVLQAYAAFANGGRMMRPYVVRRVLDPEGREHIRTEPASVRRIGSRATIETLRPVFREVLSDSGTATLAAVQGISASGKTGTAKKFIDGEYRDAYYASFVGFFPERAPRYTVLVMLDEPRLGSAGGWTAGRTFAEITKRIAGYDGRIATDAYAAMLKQAGADTVRRGSVRVPDMRGWSVDEAVRMLELLEIPHSLLPEEAPGSTLVSAQSPAPGEWLVRGNPLILYNTPASQDRSIASAGGSP